MTINVVYESDRLKVFKLETQESGILYSPYIVKRYYELPEGIQTINGTDEYFVDALPTIYYLVDNETNIQYILDVNHNRFIDDDANLVFGTFIEKFPEFYDIDWKSLEPWSIFLKIISTPTPQRWMIPYFEYSYELTYFFSDKPCFLINTYIKKVPHWITSITDLSPKSANFFLNFYKIMPTHFDPLVRRQYDAIEPDAIDFCLAVSDWSKEKKLEYKMKYS